LNPNPDKDRILFIYRRFKLIEDKAKESCGVVGIFGDPNAALKVYHALYTLQHRGQESVGIVVSDGRKIQSKKGLGLLTDVFKDEYLNRLPGHIGVGHVRYSTTGSGRVQNIQPLIMEHLDGLIVVAHNGNLVNARTLRRQYQESGSIFQTSTDSEIVAHLLADPCRRNRADRFESALGMLKGAFSFVLMTETKLIAARDPQGFRPLCMGKMGDALVFVSETCALDILGAEYIRDVNPGEVITVDENGMKSTQFANGCKHAHCIFEHIYFARPDSVIFGQNVHMVRMALGRRLAQDCPVDADVVIAVPDSGNSSALGFALESGIPLDHGYIRNHYIGRTFIMPTQENRSSGVEIKLNVVKEVVRGKRVVVVDDSIIRGTTSKNRVRLLRQAGAKEVHLRISCPPTLHPCYFGIDFPTTKELVAAGKTWDEIAAHLGADSLGYQSIEGLLSCVNKPEGYCNACFSGNYPVEVEDRMENKFDMERC